MSLSAQPVGPLLRDWRRRRRLSQLALAAEAEISQRHLSFVESGRARPSRDMVLALAERLDVPLRERNVLLVAAGFAPVFAERALGDAALKPALATVETILAGHAPNPALAVDRHWTLVAANRPAARLMEAVPPAMRRPPVNVLRASLHPEGLAPQIVNFAEWRAHVLARLGRQVEISADRTLAALLDEIAAYPMPAGVAVSGVPAARASGTEFAVPFRLRTATGAVHSFITTTTVFGTPIDITLAELAIESLFPADAETAAALRALADAS
jgi:transcriptional regulator with XRE-family HTH domain